jgi:hypothetical protein
VKVRTLTRAWITESAQPGDKTLAVGRMPPSGMLGRVGFVRADVSEELSASIIMVTRIGELGTMLAPQGFRFHGVDYEEWCLLECYALWLL